MFSSTAEYALRAVVHLAAHHGQPRTTEQIAESTKVPPGYLSKVLQDLGAAKLVQARRGPSGGFTLLREPHALSVLDVINAVDPLKRIERCPLGIPSHGTRLCRLHRRLDDAIAGVEKALAESTIAEMIDPDRKGMDAVFPLAIDPAAAKRSRKSDPS